MKQLTRKLFLRSALALVLTSSVLTGCRQSDHVAKTNPAPFIEPASKTTAFYLVRHAEKRLEGDDPELSAEGYARAEALAVILRNIELDGVYSTDTRRTRDTAAPTLAGSKLDLLLYDGRDLSGFALELSDVEGNYLIVGHSNTTPDLVGALGGDGGTPIVEADEYDRLYIVTREDGVVETDLRRYP